MKISLDILLAVQSSQVLANLHSIKESTMLQEAGNFPWVIFNQLVPNEEFNALFGTHRKLAARLVNGISPVRALSRTRSPRHCSKNQLLGQSTLEGP
ncbi:hypothetical protein PSACC_01013 [Paramicrosporidium saccamoebae]|uniref:Uncharacterized protein n=1 Tax=Paramicrosporidium saccamoebae TaxID=1246581 RepID=A0A2H9TN21_9FUNG|nr:hypothetical protein PSACC_01013 [Paramicrosporidium saccamoebae]